MIQLIIPCHICLASSEYPLFGLRRSRRKKNASGGENLESSGAGTFTTSYNNFILDLLGGELFQNGFVYSLGS